jgi:hypothetical protein
MPTAPTLGRAKKNDLDDSPSQQPVARNSHRSGHTPGGHDEPKATCSSSNPDSAARMTAVSALCDPAGRPVPGLLPPRDTIEIL